MNWLVNASDYVVPVTNWVYIDNVMLNNSGCYVKIDPSLPEKESFGKKCNLTKS